MRNAKKQQKKYTPICRTLFRRALNAVIDKQRRIEGKMHNRYLDSIY